MLTLLPEGVEGYAVAHSSSMPPLLQELAETTTEEMGDRARMLSGPLVGMLLQMLVASTRASRVLEIGTFTGFSALMMAQSLPREGELVTCECDPKALEIARAFFGRSEHGSKIRVLEGSALDGLRTVRGPFDLVFIDADKASYTAYYEAALPLLSQSGLIAVDNVLWSGKVLDPQDDDDFAIAAFNDHVQRDSRVTNVTLPVRDGVMLIARS